MSDKKKDLTRIEDMGEFLHELNADEETNDFLADLPDLPSDESESTGFSLDDDTSSDSEEAPAFESSNFESSDFESSESDFESPAFGEDENNFSSNDFGTSFGEDSGDSPSFLSDSTESETENETPAWNTDFTSETDESSTADSMGDDFLGLGDNKADEVQDVKTKVDTSSTDTFELPSIDQEEVEEKEKTEVPEEVSYKPEPEYKAPETFQDVKAFSESSNFSGMATEGNPSFSILVKNVRFIEDVNDIVSLLKEFNLLADSEEQTKNRLMRGTLLIPRISEFAAIFMGHKLRRFDVDLQIGLSDEIHPPKHQEAPETGIVSKHSLYQNQTHHFHFDDPKLEISQIIIAATPTLEGYQVVRYIGVASEHKMLDSTVVEDENSSEVPAHYQELAQKLKAHALKNNSNAVVGLNYQLTPIPSEYGVNGHKYRLTCTGNLVWINKL